MRPLLFITERIFQMVLVMVGEYVNISAFTMGMLQMVLIMTGVYVNLIV